MDSAVTSTSPTPRPQPKSAVEMHECREAMVPIAEVMAQIGSKWTIYVILALGRGPMRFSELLRAIEGISQKMLTTTLRDLERDGFITRTVTPSIPPRVDYELTGLGRELREPLKAISAFAHANRQRVHEARKQYAEREAEARRLAW